MALTYEDCQSLCGLTEEEIEALAEHEHIPEIVAAELGNYLVHSEDGDLRIKQCILDDIEEARKRGHAERVGQLEQVLKHFVATHPRTRGGSGSS